MPAGEWAGVTYDSGLLSEWEAPAGSDLLEGQRSQGSGTLGRCGRSSMTGPDVTAEPP